MTKPVKLSRRQNERGIAVYHIIVADLDRWETRYSAPMWQFDDTAVVCRLLIAEVRDLRQRLDDATAEIAKFKTYIRDHHNGYDSAARGALDIEQPADEFAALRELVEEGGSATAATLKALNAALAELRSIYDAWGHVPETSVLGEKAQ